MDIKERPWIKYYDPEQTSPELEYPDVSIYEMVNQAAARLPDAIACEFYGKKTKYKEFIRKTNHIAACLYKMGLRKGDSVLICMPNSPQGIQMLYAASKLGCVVAIIHPLSAKKEILHYLNNSKAKVALVLDAFVNNFIAVKNQTNLDKIIVTSVKDEFNLVTKVGYVLTTGRKVPKYEMHDYMIKWKKFLSLTKDDNIPDTKVVGADPALILYSGGTTGVSKGILLSNLSINATSIETLACSECLPGRVETMFTEKMREYLDAKPYTILSVMPMFHGFGLGVGIHTFLIFGGKCVLVPNFTPESYAKLIIKKKPNFIAGVPTLYEKMVSLDVMKNADMSGMYGVFCGGDSLPMETREIVNEFLTSHGSKVLVREGYGLTECVTVSCLTPTKHYREGSIGIPLPDVVYKIVKYGTHETLPYGEEGEICISGPNVMMGYVDDEETTKIALQVHDDGKTWLHTGDAGTMDEDGFIYFKQRYKRIIVSSGYNIYPSQIEAAVDKFPGVKASCAIGIPDRVRKQRVKVYVVLNDDMKGTEELKKKLIAHCREYVAAYAVPKLFEFIDDLPKTKVGKIAYTELEEMDRKKREAAKSK